jgi:hypothetical protein
MTSEDGLPGSFPAGAREYKKCYIISIGYGFRSVTYFIITEEAARAGIMIKLEEMAIPGAGARTRSGVADDLRR